MRKLVLLLLIPFLGGCVISLAPEDRERVDKFLVEARRFNDSVDAIKEVVLPKPEPPPSKTTRKLAKVSNE